MKYSLLEIVQTVLSSMDSDEVNTINDTPESQQVVEVVKSVYDDIISRSDLHSNKQLFNLEASNDNTRPIIMYKPEIFDRISWVKYDGRLVGETIPNWIDLVYLPVDEFIHYMHQQNQNYDYVEVFDQVLNGSTITFVYRNDIAPSYYTSIDDQTLIFDAYDNSVDTTLQASKTLCYGTKATNFEKTDDFVPDLQPQQFALLINESKSLAWAELKQTVHAKAEAIARKNWIHVQKTRQTVPDGSVFKDGSTNFDKLPNFSRRR